MKCVFFSSLADYIRYKEQHRQDRDVTNDHEHNQIGQIYFDFYRVTGKTTDFSILIIDVDK